MVQPKHIMWRYLLESGAQPQELYSLCENPSLPDIIGINHYVTSDRFLDERIERYPPETHGGNRWQAYADDAAVRVCGTASGFEAALREAHARYRKPIALTEVHLGSTPDEQLRWFMQAWEAANKARATGIDVRAVTAWSLLGSLDWDSLVTQPNEHYEAGVFDASQGQVRRTTLETLSKLLPAEKRSTIPSFTSPVGGVAQGVSGARSTFLPASCTPSRDEAAMSEERRL